MKKQLSIGVLSLLLLQYILSPFSYTFAASGSVSEYEHRYKDGTVIEGGSNQPPTIDPYQQMIGQFLRMDLSLADPLTVVQVAAYLYLHDRNVTPDMELGDDSLAMQAINTFLRTYARNIGFLANDEGGEDFFRQKVESRKINYPQEYSAVYTYAKDIQSKYRGGVANTPVPAIPPKTDANTSNTVSCKELEDRWMQEYYKVINIPNVSYDRIAHIKQQVHAAQSGENCHVAAGSRQVTAEAVQTKHQETLSQVKQALNFSSQANIRVIPDHVPPAYCEDPNFGQDLVEMTTDRLSSMRDGIESFLQEPDVADSLVKTNAVKAMLQQLGFANTLQAAQVGDAPQAFHNFVQGLVSVASSMANARGLTHIMRIVETNQGTVEQMFSHIGEVFDGIQSLKIQAGGGDYNWNPDNKKFEYARNSDGTLSFLFPSNDAAINDVKFSMITAQFEHISVKQQPYIQTEYKGALSLEQFVYEAKQNGYIRGQQMHASALGERLTQQIIAYAPEYYQYNDTQYPTVFIAEAGGVQRVFLNYNLDELMPQGRFVDPWGSEYVIGEQGQLLHYVYVEQVPKALKLSLQRRDRLLLGVDAQMTYDEKAIAQGEGATVPQSVKAQVYVADYTFDFAAERVLGGQTNTLQANLQIHGPGICQLEIQFVMNYGHDGNLGYPHLEDGQTNIQNASLGLYYNQQVLVVSIDDFAALTQAMHHATSHEHDETEDGEQSAMLAMMDAISNHVLAQYQVGNQVFGVIMPDTDHMVVVQYPDGSTESIMEVVFSYMHLLQLDAVMGFVERYFGRGGDNYYDDKYSDGRDISAGIGDQRKLYTNTYYTDADNILYISYQFRDQDGNVYDIHPDKVSIEVSTTDGRYSYPMLNSDGYIYTIDITDVLYGNDVNQAYVSASYSDGRDTFDYRQDIISPNYGGDGGNYNDPKDLPQQQYDGYQIQVQSMQYPDVGIVEYVFMLYDQNNFPLYHITPNFVVYNSIGSNCFDEGGSCTIQENALYPTYLDGVPTYILDIDAIMADQDVFESYVIIEYVDETGYVHNHRMGLKKPIQ